MEIYNTLSRKKELFEPLNPPYVNMYVCGPTVYDYFHIGNARTFVMSDVIRRYLEYKGYKVKYAMNLTDVDDKIIKKANEEKSGTDKVAKKYIDAFFEDLEKLRVKKATVYPKATEHMDDIIKLISELEKKGIAYNVDGDVFYDVSKFKGYGKLSGKKTDELESGSRVEINEAKKNPLDFALWKKAKEGEPYWESPWGNGRPGWHIECSAMSCKHLGETFDIHAGGNDLIFPHHENEIAQSEGATGKQFVKYWMHFGFLNIDNEKMSKSLGNFFTAREILKKYPAEAIRYLFVQSNYGGPLNFNEELLQSSKKGLEKLKNLAEKTEEEIKLNNEEGKQVEFDFDKYYKSFETEMDNDFNTSKAVAIVFDFVREVNRVIAAEENISVSFYDKVKEFLSKTAEGVLGIIDFSGLSVYADESLQNDLIELLIKLRLEAKQEKNYSLADKIRNELNEMGVILQDSKDKTTFKISKK